MAQGVIYMYTNKLNGKMYIGQTTNEHRRRIRHLTAARCHNTKNEGQPFIHALREYGVDAFEYTRLCVIDDIDDKEELKRELWALEEFYIGMYDAVNKGYNVTLGGGGMKGYKLSPKSVQRIRVANLGRKITEQQKLAVSTAAKRYWDNPTLRKIASAQMSGENNPMYGVHLCGQLNPMYRKRHSEETRAKISKALTGKTGHKLSPEHIEKIREIAKRPKSEEHKQHLREALLRKSQVNKQKRILQYTADGTFVKEWESIVEAQTELDIVHISECALRKRNYAGGFIWRFKDDSGAILPESKNKRKIALIDKDGNVTREFPSIAEASRQLHIRYSGICAVVQGLQHHTKGYSFKYI